MEQALAGIVERIERDFSLRPVLACEVEFYLHGVAAMGRERALQLLRAAALSHGMPIAQLVVEEGAEQCEVSFQPVGDVTAAVQAVAAFKALPGELFSSQGITTDFSAKPYPDQPGSGLHVHVHLVDAQGKNVFTRAGDEMDSPFSEPLLHSIGGLLALMNASMQWFAPSQASYARFIPKTNTPTTVSWGTNNRTVAVRLPTKAISNKHIEHRVAGADADVASVLFAVLVGVHFGLKHKCDAGEPVYGDASLAQYHLPKLAASLDEAEGYYRQSAVLAEYIS